MANVTTARMRVTLDTSMMVRATAGYFDFEEVLGGPDVTRMKMPGTLDGKYLEKYMAAGTSYMFVDGVRTGYPPGPR